MLSISSYGQDVQKEFSSILEMALSQKRIPELLVVDSDTLFADKVLERFIVVKATDQNKLSRSSTQPGDSRVEIWTDEDIFLHNITYWMIPSLISIANDKAKLEYETTTYGQRKDMQSHCYKGKITAKKKNGKWVLTSGVFQETVCNFEFYGHGKK